MGNVPRQQIVDAIYRMSADMRETLAPAHYASAEAEDSKMLETFIEEFASELEAEAWTPFVSGEFLLRTILVFVAGAALYFILSERNKSSSLILRYIFPSSVWRCPTHSVDLLNFIFRKIFTLPFVAGLYAVTTYWIGGSVSEALLWAFGPRRELLQTTGLIVTIQFLVLTTGRSLIEYYAHRLQHEVPFLWSFHRGHHSAEGMSIFTSSRFPIGEALTVNPLITTLNATLLGLTAYLMGAGIHPLIIKAQFVYGMLIGLYAVFAHSHVPISFGWFNRVLAGPVLHQIHHSAEPRHHDKNYSTDWAIWDWMFGTLYIPDKDETWRLGLEHEREDHNPHTKFREFHLEPFRHAWQTIKEKGLDSVKQRCRTGPNYLRDRGLSSGAGER